MNLIHNQIGEILVELLARVQWTFANWRNSSMVIGEIPVWLLAKFQYGYWRNSSMVIGESSVEFRHWRKSYWRKSYWRKSEFPSERLSITVSISHTHCYTSLMIHSTARMS
jgi:hypothetical protein